HEPVAMGGRDEPAEPCAGAVDADAAVGMGPPLSGSFVSGPGPGGFGGAGGGVTARAGTGATPPPEASESKLRRVLRPQKGQSQATSNRRRSAPMAWAGDLSVRPESEADPAST